ncbi:hypothetical protein KBX50_04680 [Micromonospora sp. C51]|uniref:hypothetical protein n=1 Tax=Micromonospora sp. C51 TaxID=2824879 RepID=UPI001B377AD8|nr:hypothetical protein [Micromonospora sp. C51]MBQ1047784.1 hypothetical protein [Micromonospora sp. C51]
MSAPPVPHLPVNRDRMVFAKAIQARCVTEWPVGHRTETRRRRIGGNNSLRRPSWLRCKRLADEFDRAQLAVRPTQNLPAEWSLTPAGEAWLIAAQQQIEGAPW